MQFNSLQILYLLRTKRLNIDGFEAYHKGNLTVVNDRDDGIMPHILYQRLKTIETHAESNRSISDQLTLNESNVNASAKAVNDLNAKVEEYGSSSATYTDNAVQDLKTEILNDSTGAYNTLLNLKDELEGSDTLTTLVNTIGNKLSKYGDSMEGQLTMKDSDIMFSERIGEDDYQHIFRSDIKNENGFRMIFSKNGIEEDGIDIKRDSVNLNRDLVFGNEFGEFRFTVEEDGSFAIVEVM